MKDPFCYQPPTPITAPKYAAIRTAEANVRDRLGIVLNPANDLDRQARYTVVNDACRAFAELIESTCPPSADASAAIRCVRLARMAANEAIGSVDPADSLRRAVDNLIAARWQACAAVALADEPAAGAS